MGATEAGKREAAQVQQLVTLRGELYQMAMGTDDLDLRGYYLAAHNHVLYATNFINKAKELLIGE